MKFAVFSRVIQVVLTEKMAFEQSLEGSVGEEHSRRGKHSTIPEVAGCPECPRNSEKDACDYMGPTWITQALSISRSLT